MTTRRDDDDAGRGSLRARLPHVTPPSDLEARVHASLEARGLIDSARDRAGATRRRTTGAWLRRAGLLTAGVVLGFGASRVIRGADRRPADASAGQYVLLLYGDPPDDTGAVHVAREREYGRWASTLRGARWVGGHELADVVDQLGPARQGDAPNADRLAGYFVIEASSRERAAEVARTCPHLRYGGRIVVMTIAG